MRSWTPTLLTLLAALLTGQAMAEPARLLLAVGSDVGGPEDVPLKYADADARRFRDVMVELGQVQTSRAYLVEDATVDSVRAAFAELRGRVAELRAQGAEVSLFIFVSAHARDGRLQLRGTELELKELRGIAGGVQAPLLVLILDTCESGVAARRKGGARVRGYELSLERLPLRGEVLISSSGPAESAEEWDSLGGSLFTHHLITGLRGDADAEGDGRVTLAEGYSYAFRRTVASSASAQQHPMADLDLSGTGELVLTELAGMKSGLLFPAGLEGRYVVISQPEPKLLLEVEKVAGKPLRLAVPAGRYLVRKRLGALVGLLAIELPYGGHATVDDAKMTKRSFTEVALKGGRIDLKSSTVALLGRVHSPPVAQTGARPRVGLAYRHTFGEWWAMGGVSAGRASYRGVGLGIEEQNLLLEVGGGYRYLGWPVIPYAGLELRWWIVRQRFERDREAEIQQVYGGGPLPERLAHGQAPAALVGLEIPLAWGLVVLAQAEVEVRRLPAVGEPEWSLGVGGALLVGLRF